MKRIMEGRSSGEWGSCVSQGTGKTFNQGTENLRELENEMNTKLGEPTKHRESEKKNIKKRKPERK